MDYDIKKIAKLYQRVYSTKPNTKEREAELSKLSDEDNAALYDYSVGLLSGRIKKMEAKEIMADRTKSYEWYKGKMESSESGTMQQISQFAMRCPELYKRYRQQYQSEKDEERRKHNYKLAGY